jgi:hypothetical protein
MHMAFLNARIHQSRRDQDPRRLLLTLHSISISSIEQLLIWLLEVNPFPFVRVRVPSVSAWLCASACMVVQPTVFFDTLVNSDQTV